MAPKLDPMLRMSGAHAAALPFGLRYASSELISKDPDASGCAAEQEESNGAIAQSGRRTRIWEFGTNLHCSIIGTCLSTAELRQILGKLKVNGVAGVSDHDLHCLGVMLASRREGGAKFLQKALDRRHRSAIGRYAKLKEPAGVLELWDQALKQGDIPGAYWAVLTHPATTEEVVKKVFADVHMLSHLVGAANRADIRRLRELELENAALSEKMERQQRQLNEGFARRDQALRQLNDLLAQQASERLEDVSSADKRHLDGEVDVLVEDLSRRLARETARRERSEQRASELSETLRENMRALRASRQECESLRQELDLVDRELAASNRPDPRDFPASLDLSDNALLYIGGRAHQIPQLKGMIERTGARFLHHDGGIEHSSGLIAGLISRADRVLFPVGCISHEAVAAVKRLCRISGKPYEPLRTASLTCLLSALVRMSGNHERAAAE